MQVPPESCSADAGDGSGGSSGGTRRRGTRRPGGIVGTPRTTPGAEEENVFAGKGLKTVTECEAGTDCQNEDGSTECC